MAEGLCFKWGYKTTEGGGRVGGGRVGGGGVAVNLPHPEKGW